MTKKILFVDDEPNVLQSFKRQLRKRFDLEVAESGEEALQIMKEHGPFAVIVSDMRMPNMNGVELLKRSRDLYPDTVRLMLTGNADQETAMEAVNSGQIFRFLTKPCPQAFLVTSLALALRQYRLITAEKDLLQNTLKGSIAVLAELLSIAHPLAFSAGTRIKKYTADIAQLLNIPNSWQLEIAAMISQIGCITLPVEVLNKAYVGQELTPEEKEMFENHPSVGASFIEKIPRLENVSKMIALQQKRYDEYSEDIIESEYEEVLLGGQILKAVIDLDRLISRGGEQSKAIEWMQKQKGCYNLNILKLFEKIKYDADDLIFSLPVNQITEGMIAADDIVAINGVLIIPKGQLITKPLLQGLRNFSLQVGVVSPIKVQVSSE
ncbi:MAG: HD domain-containing phosphohydrolase [Eubacteriaceae bacterium]